MSTDSIRNRTQLLDGEIRIMRSEVQRVTHSVQTQKEKIKENTERIKVAPFCTLSALIFSYLFIQVNKVLPYLVSNVVEMLDLDPTAGGEVRNKF